MRQIAGWLLAAALAAQGLTLGYGLATEAGGGITILTVRGLLVAVVLTGTLAFLLVWKRTEILASREVSVLLDGAVLALGTASALLMTAAHLSIAHGVAMAQTVDIRWLSAHAPSVILAGFTAVATEAAAAAVAWVWPALPRTKDMPEYLEHDWRAIDPVPVAGPATKADKRSYEIERTDAGYVALCSCAWRSAAKPEKLAAKRAWSAHRCPAGAAK